MFCVTNRPRWKGKGTKEVGNEFKLYYCGPQRGRNRVRITVNSEWKEQVVEVKRFSDRFIIAVLLAKGSTVIVIAAYSPQMGFQEKEIFKEELETVITMVRMETK